jgi:hypothetical protein
MHNLNVDGLVALRLCRLSMSSLVLFVCELLETSLASWHAVQWSVSELVLPGAS